MQMNTYLHFNGTTAEAMRFYAKVFGAPEPEILPQPDDPTLVMHAQIEVPGGTLMASDFPADFDHQPQQAVSIHVFSQSPDETRQYFDALAEGGDVISPIEANFFSPAFGFVRDRFGTHWMLNTAPAES